MPEFTVKAVLQMICIDPTDVKTEVTKRGKIKYCAVTKA